LTLTDAWGNIIKTYEFSPYGRVLQESGAAPNDFVFPGTYVFLPDAPSYPLSPARLYSALAGRFGSRDPIWAGTAPWSSPYSYVEDAPTVRVDLWAGGT